GRAADLGRAAGGAAVRPPLATVALRSDACPCRTPYSVGLLPRAAWLRRRHAGASRAPDRTLRSRLPRPRPRAKRQTSRRYRAAQREPGRRRHRVGSHRYDSAHDATDVAHLLDASQRPLHLLRSHAARRGRPWHVRVFRGKTGHSRGVRRAASSTNVTGVGTRRRPERPSPSPDPRYTPVPPLIERPGAENRTHGYRYVLAPGRRPLLVRLRGSWIPAAGSAHRAQLVPSRRAPGAADDRHDRHRDPAAVLARLPVAVLGDDRARPDHV